MLRLSEAPSDRHSGPENCSDCIETLERQSVWRAADRETQKKQFNRFLCHAMSYYVAYWSRTLSPTAAFQHTSTAALMSKAAEDLRYNACLAVIHQFLTNMNQVLSSEQKMAF
jgi:hypothetical protein